MFEHISYEKDGRVVTVTIRRPEVMNALHFEANLELGEAWRRYEADDEAWVAIVTGAGERAFSAGADLKRISSYSQQMIARELEAGGFGGLTHRFGLFKPVIAAVNGVALGGGLELALCCDVIVAAEHARFALPEPRVGAIASGGGIHRSVRQLPHKVAMGLLLSGRQMTAQEAHQWGLVNEVVPSAGLMPAARRLADDILKCSPLSVWATKQAALEGANLPLAEAMDRSRYELTRRWMASEDRVEGPRAFNEKRRPIWLGR